MTSDQLAKDMREHGLVFAIQDLKNHLEGSGVSATKTAQIITDVFGRRSLGAILPLIQHVDDLRQRQEQINKTTANFGEAWDKTRQQSHFAVDQMKASLQTLMIVAGNAIEPVIEDFSKWVTHIAKSKQAQDELRRTVQALAKDVEGAARAIKTMKQALDPIAASVGGWNSVFKIILAGVLANKFLNLASAVRGSRLAMIALGTQAPKTAAAVVAGEAEMSAGATTLAGRLGSARLALIALTRAIGPAILAWGAYKLATNQAVQDFFNPPSAEIPQSGSQTQAGDVYLSGLDGKWHRQKGKSPKQSDPVVPKPGKANYTPFLNDAGSTAYRPKPKASTPNAPTSPAAPPPYNGSYNPGGSGSSSSKKGGPTGGDVAKYAIGVANTPGARAAGFSIPGGDRPGALHQDCSSFAQAVFRRYGVDIGGNTYAQQHAGTAVNRNDIQPGDIILFAVPSDSQPPPNHVGIYVGGGRMVHDHGQSAGVSTEGAFIYPIVTIRRVLRKGGATGPTGLSGGSSASSAASTAQQKASIGAQLTKDVSAIGDIVATHAISPKITGSLKAQVNALNRELDKAGSADIPGIRRRMKNLEDAIKEAAAQALDVKKIRGMINQLHDELKNGLISPVLERQLETKLMALQALLRNHLLSPAQRKEIEAQIKAAGARIKDALQQMVDVKGLDKFINEEWKAIKQALGENIDEVAPLEKIKTMEARVNEIRHILMTQLLTPAQRKKLEEELGADEATLKEGIDGLISVLADAKTRFENAWSAFKDTVLNALSEKFIGKFDQQVSGAGDELSFGETQNTASRAWQSIDKLATDPQAKQAQSLLHGLADAWTTYYQALALDPNDPSKGQKVHDAIYGPGGIIDAENHITDFSKLPGLSEAAQNILGFQGDVVQGVTSLGEHAVTAARDTWQKFTDANSTAISTGLDQIGSDLESGKITLGQAWQQVHDLLVNHGFTDEEATQMAAPMLNATSDLGGALAQLIAAIQQLVAALEGLKTADSGSSFDKLRTAIKNTTIDVAALKAGLAGLPGVTAGGGGTGALAGASAGTGTTSGSGACFAAGTPVAVPGGERPIEQLGPGDEILVWDFGLKRVVSSLVEGAQRHEGEDERRVIVLELDSGIELRVTPEHPFFTSSGWVAAAHLRLGSRLALRGRGELQYALVARLAEGERQAVYNLHVEHDDHNYFAADCLVHNVKVPTMSSGGPVVGWDRGFDTVHVRLRPGEFVLKQEAVRALGGAGVLQRLVANLPSTGTQGRARLGTLPALAAAALSPGATGAIAHNTTHLQSNVHLHVHGPVLGTLEEFARAIAVPVRDAQVAQIGRWNRDIFDGMA